MSRESELYKDKIEVSLDGRQIFYLFFGGAVIVGMVFVLGVMVGRRVEARGHVERAHVESAVDPLAALDRLEGGSGLSFQGALGGGGAGPSDVEKTIAELAKKPVVPAAASAPVAPAAPVAKPEKKVEKAEKVEDKKPDKADKVEDKKPEKADKAEKVEDKKPRFTLQLSSFQDKTEAQAFLDAIKSSGFGAYLTEGSVDGKTFYRVRMGSFRTLEAANDAKADFEKSAKKSAQVMKL